MMIEPIREISELSTVVMFVVSIVRTMVTSLEMRDIISPTRLRL